ncbi:MAG: F0F1 ATP synthase subunit delta [Sphingobium sp. 32-64-5]|nr:MAG: F0F1 ATP synthase subunit delta [Sphingobium sp. 32-64-5]
MENSGGIQASLSGRYALALFELARDNNQLESEDFRNLTTSPVIGRGVASKAVAALAAPLGLDPLTSNFLGVLAQARRLSQLPAAIRAFETLLSQHKGETRAEVTSAHALTKTQVTALAKSLKTRVGRDVAVDVKVDPSILGGLIVKIGSQMIDSSIRTRLNTLAQAMKG